MSSPASRTPEQDRQQSNVQSYIFLLCVVAFSVISYIFNSIQGMEGTAANPFTSGTKTNLRPKGSSKLDKFLSSDIDNSWEPFNSTNPHADSWCPKATCLNSPLCRPCERRHFFIFSTARSGSTTLLRMFNALPNMRLAGENHNEMWYLSEMTNNLVRNRPKILKHKEDKPTGPFAHNYIPDGSMGCVAQHALHNLNPPPMAIQQNKDVNMEEYDRNLILGFKGVRLHHGNWTGKEAADYIKSHFPCSRVVINYQTNVTHQYESFKRTFNHTDGGVYLGPSKENLRANNDWQREFWNSLGSDMAWLIDMDKWTQDVGVLNKVVNWLGYENCVFKAIAHENDKGYAPDTKTDLDLGERCIYPYI